jgi:predicted ATPase/class 3 adenylate cyclase
MSAAQGPGVNGLLPSGTVTFVFTDVEGSTQRWERDPQAMQTALRRHDALVRSALEAYGGYVFKTIGDAFCAAFERPADALSGSLAVQRALAAEDFVAVGGLRVRAAIHTGTADEREGDYFGTAVNRVARLLAIAHGGQVIVSGSTAQLAADALPQGAALLDLGHHRLKDLAQAMHVFGLTAPDLASVFPPLRSLESHANNLPLELTSFIGRAEEIAQVVELLRAHRVVTITGAGGIGKTRTALHVAVANLEAHDDGAWFVDLAPVAEGGSIPGTIAQALERKISDGDALASLTSELSATRALLVLDNCEHLIDASAAVVSTLVHHCPHLVVLATSRQSLGIAGEAVYPLPSLPPPVARELFSARAKAIDARFQISDNDASVVDEICTRLDGIALAIELAAARTKMLSLAKLRDLLEERFRILSGGSRDALPRQQTMRATIDWSYNLLTEPERALLRRTGIFAGGWTLEAAEAVCTGDALPADELFDLHFSLIEKSLVVGDIGASDTRYRLLESTRSYALEKLAEIGESDSVAHAHSRWVSDFAEAAYSRTWQMPLARWAPGIEPEADNIRTALHWTLGENADPVRGGAIAGAMITFWYRRPTGTIEGRRWVEAALARIEESEQPHVVARLHFTLALLTDGERSLASARRAVALYERLGDRFHIAFGYRQLAVSELQARRPADALESIDRALGAFEEARSTAIWPYATTLGVRGSILTALGRDAEARSMFARALAFFAKTGDEQRAAFHRMNWARLEFACGNYAVALEAILEAAKAIRDSPYFGHEAVARASAASCRLMLDDVAGAEADATAALRLAKRAQAAPPITFAIANLAAIAARRGDFASAATLSGFCDAWYRTAAVTREPLELRPFSILMSALEQSLPADQLATLRAQGAALDEDQAVSLALSIERPPVTADG